MEHKPIAFAEANRMSATGIIILFIRQIISLVKSLGFIMVYAIYKYRSSEAFETYGMQFIWLGIAMLLVIAAIIAILKFRNFKFYIDTEQSLFIVEKGILSKEKIIVQLNKIFQINLQQNVWQQVLDLYSLEIETAGSARAEVNIPALSERVALQLKTSLESSAQLNQAERENQTETAEPSSAKPFFIGNKNIAYAAMLSHYGSGLRVAAGFILFLWFQFQEFSGTFTERDDYELLLLLWEAVDLNMMLIFAGLFLLIPFLVNLFRFVIRYYNISYKLAREQELHINFGLFTLQQRIFKIKKLQELNIASNWFLKQRKLSIVSLHQSDNAEGQKQKNTITFPGLPAQQLADMEQLFYGQSIKLGASVRPYINKLWLDISLRVLFFAVIAAALFHWAEMPATGLYFFAAIIIWNIAIAIIRFKNDVLFLHPDFIIKQSGGLRKNLQIIEPHKIQNIELNQKIWKPKFGSIRLHTASGVVAASWYDFKTIKNWSEHLMLQIIGSKQDWM